MTDRFVPLAVVPTGAGSVRLVGELDVAGVPEVSGQLARLDEDLTIDCSGLTFIDAAGVGMLVGIHRRCEARGARLVLVDPARCLSRVLELTHLDTLFDVQSSPSSS